MPLYRTDHVEYNIESGHITIAMEDGSRLPAYWAHPARGNKFPGVALIHNWWGITAIVRRMANLYAQCGYYTVIPDLFDGKLPKTHTEAVQAVQTLGDDAFVKIDAALSVLEGHNMTSTEVAAVGIGMGGTLAFQAAIERDDLEVAVAFYGYPQKFLGQFSRANTPTLAVFGTEDPFIKPIVIDKLEAEFKQTPLKDKHRVLRVDGAKHDFIVDHVTGQQRQYVSTAWQSALDFIESHIEPPARPTKKKVY
jgi:carboxymethylenebutenolidase